MPTGAASVEGNRRSQRAECKELSGGRVAKEFTNQRIPPRILYRSGSVKTYVFSSLLVTGYAGVLPIHHMFICIRNCSLVLVNEHIELIVNTHGKKSRRTENAITSECQ